MAVQGVYGRLRLGRKSSGGADLLAAPERRAVVQTPAAVTPAAPAPGRAVVPAPRIPESLVPWIFAAKTTAAGLLALLIAFRLDLDQPSWALLTVFIVAQPKDGMVLAKSFYRIIGTSLGAAVALALVALFAQQRELFLGALALWIGLCTFASQYARNWPAYAFVLSGYTAAIVGIPGALAPGNAFFIAVARVTEISLAIATTAAISHLVLPMSLAGSLRQAIAEARRGLCDYAIALLAGRDAAALRAKLLASAVAIDTLRDSVIFEDRAIRDRADLLKQLSAALVGAVDLAHVLGRELTALRRGSADAATALDDAVDATRQAIDAWRDGAIDAAGLARRLRQAEALLPSTARLCADPAQPAAELLPRLAALGVLRQFFAALGIYAEADEAFAIGERWAPRRAGAARDTDFADAAVTGLRAALAVGLVGWFWIAADWTHGSTATILAALATSRLATMGPAVPLAIAGTLIFALSTVPAFILVDVVLPHVSGFGMFSLIVGPMLFLCAFLMAYRRTLIIGYLSALLFASVGTFQNRMAYDPVGLINTAIAAVLAAASALVLWAVIAPESAAQAQRRFIRTARTLLAGIATPRRRLSAAEFERAMTTALDRLRRHLVPARPADIAALDAGIALLVGGRALVRLRDGRPSPARSALERAIAVGAGDRRSSALDRARRAVAAAAEQGLAELCQGELSDDAALAAAGLIALAVAREELDWGGALVERGTKGAGGPDAA